MSTPQDKAKLETLQEIVDRFDVQLRAAKKLLRRAEVHEREAKHALALRTIDVREAREQVDAVRRELHRVLGMEEFKSDYPKTIGWDEVWCPNCKHTFVPSKPGGGERRV